MISFTDKRLYAKGICQAICSDPITGDILYYSNKFSTGNITTSLTAGEIRAGLGNSIAAIIPSDSAVSVEFTAADFNLWAKAAQVGAALSYNAPVMVCKNITATGATLTVDVSEGVPVAQLGQSAATCYVQEVGAESPIHEGGVAYPITAAGTVTGFTATTGKKYKVWHYENQASARVATLSAMFDPKVVHFDAQIPVYCNDVAASENEGTRVGWLHVIVPRLKLGGTATITGDQGNNDTTSVSGQAVAYDSDVISENCTDCEAGTLAYYIYIPDNSAQDITGLAIVGGVIEVAKSGSVQVPVKYVMANKELVTPASYAALSYSLTGAPTGTTVTAAGVLNAGTATGDCEITVTFEDFKVIANVSVTA
jgi:hypothetical protein